ncbi:MAG: hypothetical protein ABFS24_12340 [Pseudomonadota bacterium]
MKMMTEDAVVVCTHETGIVGIIATQNLVRINGRRVLVERNPEGRPIVGCPNAAPPSKPCLTTLVVQEGYSGLLRIDNKRVCLDTVTGLTDGTPPGTVKYKVRSPGQALVLEGQ